jgi:hypothetical protein
LQEVKRMFVEYHLFRTRPLEKCFFDSEEASVPFGAQEMLHIVYRLWARILGEAKKAKIPIQGYAFVDKVPAVLIRSDGSIHLLERYRRARNEMNKK